jgi:hypothetical protein
MHSFSIRPNWAVAVAKLLDSLIELDELRGETIDGVSCFHYRGKIDVEAMVAEQIANLDPTLPGYEEQLRLYEQLIQSEQNVEFWVGKDDYLLRQIEVYQDITYTEDVGEDTEREARITGTYSFRLYDFNQPIEIEPPIVE